MGRFVGELRLDVVCGHWMAEEEALAHLAVELFEGAQLALLLDALGDHGERERSSHSEDGLQQLAALISVAEGCDEAAVDLEDVDGHALHV